MSLSRLDALLFLFINRRLHAGFLDPVMALASDWPSLMVLPVVAIMAVKEKRNIFLPVAVAAAALLVSDALASALKELIRRPRPCEVLEGVRLLAVCPETFSMPSGHAAGVFSFAAPFYFFTKGRLRHTLLAIAALVSFSRIYVGVHYPSDVLVGAGLGAAEGTVLSIIFLRILQARSKK